MKNVFSVIVRLIPMAIMITLLSGMIYVSVQQSYRQNANDPQIEFAESTAASLTAGSKPNELVDSSLNPNADIATTSATYVIIYDANMKPLAASAKLNDEIPVPPTGVFDHARTEGQNRITWKPQADVRDAIVMEYVPGTTPYYVLAGRSLHEVESRVDDLSSIILVGWAVTLAATLAAKLIVHGLKAKSLIA